MGRRSGSDHQLHRLGRSLAANNFLAVSQFPVATPGRAPNIRPDVTLFVNGVPLVVIEAKPPGSDSGITDAIDQLRRYANQRGGRDRRRRGAVVLDESVHRRDHRREGRGGDVLGPA